MEEVAASHRSASRPRDFFIYFLKKRKIFNLSDLIGFDGVKPKDHCVQCLISVDTYLKVSNLVYFVSLEGQSQLEGLSARHCHLYCQLS